MPRARRRTLALPQGRAAWRMLAEGGLNATSPGLWASEYSRDGGWQRPGKYCAVLYSTFTTLQKTSPAIQPTSRRIVSGSIRTRTTLMPWLQDGICAISRREVRTPLLRTCRRRCLTLEGKRGPPRGRTGKGVSTKGDKSLHIIHTTARVHSSAAKPCT